VAASVLVAACAPTTSLSPSRTNRSGTPATPTETASDGGASSRTAASGRLLVTPVPRTPEPPATATVRPTLSSSVTPTSAAVFDPIRSAAGPQGKAYRVQRETVGTVKLEHAWAGAQTPLMEALLADLGALCPGITVEHTVQDGESMRERLVMALAGGSSPDVVMLRSDSVAYFAEQEALLPLDDLMARDGIGADWFVPSELASRRWVGRTYGLPQVTAAGHHLLFVNTDLLARIGVDPARPIETWQDLDALVGPARRADLLVLDPGRMAPGMTAHQVWTYSNGGQYWDAELQQIAWADAAGLQAAEWLLRFILAQGGSYERVASSSSARTPFSPDEWGASKYICCVNGVGWFYQLHQQAQHVRYAVYDLPRNADNPASRGATPSIGGWMLSIPRAVRDRDAAWELVKLATASVSACAFAGRQRRPSPLTGCDAANTLASSQPFWPVISANLAKTVTVPVSPIQPRLEQLYRDMQDDLLRERRPPRAALEDAALEAQRLLDEWQSSRTRG
jgi:ABC-type glycerol-3-phosphate transport system substrate-binding protein